jgi:DNA sulfur modification protein DndC
MLASLIVGVVADIPDDRHQKPVPIPCTDTRVEIPAIVEMVAGTLSRIQHFSQQSSLNFEVNLLKPPPEQSIRANLIGRGYPPTNPTFRWCTQCLKIDPVTAFVN